MAKRGRPVGTIKRLYPSRINGKVTKTYGAWQSMLARCYNPNAHNWKWYGGKGVTVCDRWRGRSTGFDSFFSDMGQAPEGLTLERIDRHKGYGPDNCRWATWKEQAANRDRRGGTKTDPDSLRQKAIAAGQPYPRVYQRVRLLGWAEAEALSTPAL